jgi:hypothetical protein
VQGKAGQGDNAYRRSRSQVDPLQCDQTKPSCLRCSRHERACVYEAVTSSSGLSGNTTTPGTAREARHGSAPSLTIVQPSPASLAVMLAESDVEPRSPWMKERSTSTGNLLHHFSNNSATIMGQPFDPQLWDLACRYKFLVSTMLAVSASHLRHYTADPSPHQIAELGQVSTSLSTLKTALSMPLHKERADALLCTAIMLNAVTFADVADPTPETSWVFSTSPDRMCWLDTLLRFKKLEQATFQYRPESVLQRLLDAANTPSVEEIDLEGVPEAWRWLIGDRDAQNFHLFCRPVQVLSKLSRYEKPDCATALAYIGVVNKFKEGFRDLLFDREPRALWIFGYWLGMLGRLKIWWCANRVTRDWAAVLSFLQQSKMDRKPGKEGQMWQILMSDLSKASEWPAPSPSSDDLVLSEVSDGTQASPEVEPICG